MEKANKHGIGGKLYKVIEKWLSGRKQRVCKGFVSSRQAVLCPVYRLLLLAAEDVKLR